jgi:hypothetical protein
VFPASPHTFYQSVVHFISCHQEEFPSLSNFFVQDVGNADGWRKLSHSALALQTATRSTFDSFANHTMYPSGPTFLEYLKRKTRKDSSTNWSVVQSDNVLAESSLFAQTFQCNVTVVWRHRGLWKLFLHRYGPQEQCSGIIILCAKMGTTLVNLAPPKAAVQFALRLCESTTNRVFPLHPATDDWFQNSAFTLDTPDSQKQSREIEEALEQATAQAVRIFPSFDRTQRDHPLQAAVLVEDNIAPDDSNDESVLTTSSFFNNSFVDDDISESSGPPRCTPPGIAAIPPHVQQNINVVAPLRALVRRRRIIVTSDDSQPSPLTASQGKQADAHRTV